MNIRLAAVRLHTVTIRESSVARFDDTALAIAGGVAVRNWRARVLVCDPVTVVVQAIADFNTWEHLVFAGTVTAFIFETRLSASGAYSVAKRPVWTGVTGTRGARHAGNTPAGTIADHISVVTAGCPGSQCRMGGDAAGTDVVGAVIVVVWQIRVFRNGSHIS
jgi:hypothetical protein